MMEAPVTKQVTCSRVSHAFEQGSIASSDSIHQGICLRRVVSELDLEGQA